MAEAVPDEDTDLVRACIQVGAERIVELRAGLDCQPDETDELFGTAA